MRWHVPLALGLAGAFAVAACSDADSSGNDGFYSSGGKGGASGGQPSSSSGTTPPPPTPDAGGSAAKQKFYTEVLPSLLTTCGRCHTGKGSDGAPGFFVHEDPPASYAKIEARAYIIAPSTSMLIKRGAHDPGVALTPEQNTLVTEWLNLELLERGDTATDNVLSRLGDCVDAELFAATGLQGMRTIPRDGENANQCAGCNNAPCATCHAEGEEAFHSYFGAGGAQTTLEALQSNAFASDGRYYIARYVSTNGPELIPSNNLYDKAEATKLGPPESHPMFEVNEERKAAIDAFANDIVTKYNAKACGQRD